MPDTKDHILPIPPTQGEQNPRSDDNKVSDQKRLEQDIFGNSKTAVLHDKFLQLGLDDGMITGFWNY